MSQARLPGTCSAVRSVLVPVDVLLQDAADPGPHRQALGRSGRARGAAAQRRHQLAGGDGTSHPIKRQLIAGGEARRRDGGEGINHLVIDQLQTFSKPRELPRRILRQAGPCCVFILEELLNIT